MPKLRRKSLLSIQKKSGATIPVPADPVKSGKNAIIRKFRVQSRIGCRLARYSFFDNYSLSEKNDIVRYPMFIRLYSIALPVFFLIDMVWLGVVARNFYQKQIGHLMRPDVLWWPAILFYVLFVVGLVVFAIAPALDKKSVWHALLYGALFGFLSYATYDLTNLATLKNWPMLVTVIDLFWGTALGALVSVISYFIARKFGI